MKFVKKDFEKALSSITEEMRFIIEDMIGKKISDEEYERVSFNLDEDNIFRVELDNESYTKPAKEVFELDDEDLVVLHRWH